METKEILKQLRESKGFKIQDVAKKIGMQYTMCREYETGSRNLGMSAAMKFANFYGVSLDYLMGREPAKNPLDALSLSDADKFIVQAYINLPPEDRTALVEIIKKIAAGADIQITTDTEKVKIQQETPQRPNIQISQIPEKAIARSKDNPFIEVPTLEQIASFTPVPEDSDL